jgi:hypothetical protein
MLGEVSRFTGLSPRNLNPNLNLARGSIKCEIAPAGLRCLTTNHGPCRPLNNGYFINVSAVDNTPKERRTHEKGGIEKLWQIG